MITKEIKVMQHREQIELEIVIKDLESQLVNIRQIDDSLDTAKILEEVMKFREANFYMTVCGDTPGPCLELTQKEVDMIITNRLRELQNDK